VKSRVRLNHVSGELDERGGSFRKRGASPNNSTTAGGFGATGLISSTTCVGSAGVDGAAATIVFAFALVGVLGCEASFVAELDESREDDSGFCGCRAATV